MGDKEQNVQSAPVWVVDDDHAIRWVLSRALSKAGIECRLFEEAESVLKALEDSAPMVLVSDIRMPGVSGVDLLARVKARMPNLPVIIMTAYSDLESAVSAFQGGAFEYLAKPFDITKAVELIERAMKEAQNMTPAVEAEAEQPASEESESQSVPDLIGQAPAMQEVFRAIGRLSHSLVTVLLTGESGAGKEVVARAIWRHSQRAAKPYIAINMAAIPRDLLESELFGHEKGAFTGATAQRLGRFEQARGGTLFLDEIGDLELSCQVKLLRVLQDQTFEVLGDSRPRKVDIRVVSATNRNLREMVVERMFREDLFYRINLITVHLPALRERKDDIPLLVRYFADKQSEINGLPTVRFSSEALTFLQKLPYPGNIRELKNLVERTILVSGKAVLEASDFESQCFHTMLSAKAEAASSLEGLTLDKLEKQTILQALKTHAGNLSHVATALGISRAALYRRLEKYDIPVDK